MAAVEAAVEVTRDKIQEKVDKVEMVQGGCVPAVALSLGLFGNIAGVFTTSYHLIDLFPPGELFLQIGITEPVVRILVPECEPLIRLRRTHS